MQEELKNITDEDKRFMQMAIQLSVENVDNGGGPFGAVIVKDGEVVATGANRVVPNNDPTAHAEVTAIRNACAKLGICYANTKADAAAIEFDDSFIYDQLDLPYEKRAIKCDHFMRNDALVAFKKWATKTDKTRY